VRKKNVFWLLFGVYQKVARWPQGSGSSYRHNYKKAKSLDSRLRGNDEREQKLDSSVRWNDEQKVTSWIRAFAELRAKEWSATLIPTLFPASG
jgi:hypothetical protein